jgi:hypothetical protein
MQVELLGRIAADIERWIRNIDEQEGNPLQLLIAEMTRERRKGEGVKA